MTRHKDFCEHRCKTCLRSVFTFREALVFHECPKKNNRLTVFELIHPANPEVVDVKTDPV